MFPYSKIIQQAWTTTKVNKFLWLFGFLLFSGTIIDIYVTATSPDLSSKIPGISSISLEQFSNFKHAPLVFLIMLFGWIMVYFRSKAALILSVRQLLKKQPASFSAQFKESREYFARLIGVSIISQLSVVLLSFVIISPVYYLITEVATFQSKLMAVLGGILFIIFLGVIMLSAVFASMYIVALKLKLLESIRLAIDLVGNFWRQLIFMGLIVLGVIVLGGVVSSLLAAPFVVFGVLSYDNEGASAVSALLFSAGLLVFWLVSGVVSAFYQTLWVVFFSEVVITPKAETEDKIPEAEVAS
jgi:hypothetical protein